MSDTMQIIKCIIVGDRGVGKTSMILKYVGLLEDTSVEYIPTTAEDSEKNINVKVKETNIPVQLHIRDTALRSLVWRNSFTSIKYKWLHEIYHHSEEILPYYFLIGCKNDLRDQCYDSVVLVDGFFREHDLMEIIPKGIIKLIEEYAHNTFDEGNVISDEEAQELGKEINAKYFSCSAKKDLQEGNIEEIFHEAAKHCINSVKVQIAPCKQSCCHVL